MAQIPTSLTTAYEWHPWSGLTLNQRTWYVPALLDTFRQTSTFQPFVPMKVDLNAYRTGTVTYNLVFDPEPRITALDNRALWAPTYYFDSAQVSIQTENHGGKLMFHDYDDMITYWQENGQVGLEPIIRNRLGIAMTQHLDILARNAFISGTFKSYAMGGATSFNNLEDGDVYDPDWADEAQLRAMTLNLPGFAGGYGNIVAITAPGTLYSINKDAGWISLNQYTEAGLQRLFTGEVGMYKGIRYVVSPLCRLYNVGAINKQVNITASASAGAGGANWGTYSIGQSGAANYLQCSAFSAGEFAVNDIVTIHTTRSSGFGVTNGVDPTSVQYMRVVKYVDADNDRLGFDRPINWDMTTDLGGGVYGYITKARGVDMTIFMAAPGGVVAGVAEPPTVHVPPVIDDFNAQHRISWRARIKYQEFRPELYEVVFHSGKHRVGATSTYGA